MKTELIFFEKADASILKLQVVPPSPPQITAEAITNDIIAKNACIIVKHVHT